MTEGEQVALLVAHPDDETLWAGGALLIHPHWSTHVATLCRASDADRAPKFAKALTALSASGKMADLDDGPEQRPLPDAAVETALLSALPERSFARILTHSPLGEYTRHRRHEEVARAALRLWVSGALRTAELWLFAYDDDRGQRLPEACPAADLGFDLKDEIWCRKLAVMLDCYGFAKDSWEARVTPRREAFWRVRSHAEALIWLERAKDRP